MSNNHKVYKYSNKGLRRVKDVDVDDRIIFMGSDQGAVAYKRDGAGTGVIIQADLFYTRPDSHTVLTDEPCPDFLYATEREFEMIEKHSMRMPCEIRKM